MYKLTKEQQVSVISALLEGNSIRSIERMTGIHRDTICRLLVRVGENCEYIMHHKLRGLQLTKIECDEIWTYVGKKHKQFRSDDPPQVGDQWVFVAMDADTKLVPCYTVGKRSEYTTVRFMWDLAHRVDNRFQLTTDGYTFYRKAVPMAFADDVDFAQLMKLYGDYGQHDAATKYSPCPIVEVISKVRSGSPDPRYISTSYIERQNLTMRMHMRRFTRLTNAFSKKLENLKAAVALHFAHYNFCRVHSSLRITPAMAAGISSSVWGVENLLPS